VPRRTKSGIPGLGKMHVRGCSRPTRPEKCGCLAWTGYHKGEFQVLHKWSGKAIAAHDKKGADVVFARMKTAIEGKTFDKAGERKTSIGGTSLFDWIESWWNTDVVDDAEAGTFKLNVSGLIAEVNLIKNGALAQRSLQDLATKGGIEEIDQWLKAKRKARKWSGKTFNEYRRLLLHLFQRAVERQVILFNPVAAIKREKGVDSQREELRHFRMTREGLQQALLDACPKLNRAQCPNQNKLTQEKADAIRAKVEGGALQKDMAKKHGVSATVISQLVNGTIWNPARRVVTTKGDEMRRRVLGAFDMGPRAEELTWFQLKHVKWNEFKLHPELGHKTYKLVLPAEKTKGGKTTGRDETFFATDPEHCKMLEERREEFRDTTLRYDAYIYGTNTGRRVAEFVKSWHSLFKATGLEYGVDYGRDVGVVWHTIKHEFASRAVEESENLEVARDRTRHKDIKTMQRYVHTKEDAAWGAAMRGAKRK
jgi:hypothetical protein